MNHLGQNPGELKNHVEKLIMGEMNHLKKESGIKWIIWIKTWELQNHVEWWIICKINNLNKKIGVESNICVREGESYKMNCIRKREIWFGHFFTVLLFFLLTFQTSAADISEQDQLFDRIRQKVLDTRSVWSLEGMVVVERMNNVSWVMGTILLLCGDGV